MGFRRTGRPRREWQALDAALQPVGVEATLRALCEKGMTSVAIAEEFAKTGTRVSPQTVRNWAAAFEQEATAA